MKKNDLRAMRHSCSHLLAVAVLELWPKVKLGIGPAIEDGFYYDFEFPKPISDKDLPKIEAKMAEIQKKKIVGSYRIERYICNGKLFKSYIKRNINE